MGLRWHASWDKHIKDFYAVASEYLGYINDKPKYKTHYLHREILNAEKEIQVDHIKHYIHSSLDNRKQNLRLTNSSQNNKNKNGKHSNNTSGYRNVSWFDSYQKWVVQLQINGKNTIVGKFDDVDEAGQFAEQKRNELYGEYAGIN